eukprot:Selendium_serpulae@DN6389_c2_g1_i2.p1
MGKAIRGCLIPTTVLRSNLFRVFCPYFFDRHWRSDDRHRHSICLCAQPVRAPGATGVMICEKPSVDVCCECDGDEDSLRWASVGLMTFRVLVNLGSSLIHSSQGSALIHSLTHAFFCQKLNHF